MVTSPFHVPLKEASSLCISPGVIKFCHACIIAAESIGGDVDSVLAASVLSLEVVEEATSALFSLLHANKKNVAVQMVMVIRFIYEIFLSGKGTKNLFSQQKITGCSLIFQGSTCLYLCVMGVWKQIS